MKQLYMLSRYSLLILLVFIPPFSQMIEGVAHELAEPGTPMGVDNLKVFIREHPNCIPTLEALAEHVRLRGKGSDKCPVPFPAGMDNWGDVASLESRIIIQVMADVVRELDDLEEKDCAFNIIIPLLNDALSGEVAGLHPSDVLQAYRDTVLDPLYPVIPEDSPQLDSYYSLLAQSLDSIDTNLRSRALFYLLRFAFLVPEKSAEIVAIIASSQPDYTPESVLFDISMIASYEERISAEELNALRNIPLATLATRALESENMRRLTTYGHLIRQKIKDGDQDSDNVRCALLVALKNLRTNSKDSRVPFVLSFVPTPIFVRGATSEQKATRDNFIALMTREVDVALEGESLEWVAVLLHRALDTNRLSLESERIQQTSRVTEEDQVYGINGYVNLLETILYKDSANTNTVRVAVEGLCYAIAMDGNLKDKICILFEQFLSDLAESHPNWDNEDWFILDIHPDCSQMDNCQHAETYYHIRKRMKDVCAINYVE